MTNFLDDPALVAEFVTESLEHLADVEGQLMAIEAGGGLDIVNTVFRAVHSIKGAAGFLGLSNINHLAHALEEVLNALRNERVAPAPELINACLCAADQLKAMLHDMGHEADTDVSEQVALLTSVLTVASAGAALAAEPPTDTTPTDPPAGPSGEALHDFLVESYENLDQMERDLLLLEREPANEPLLRGVFRNMHTLKGSAGFMGFSRLEQLTHVGECVLGALRDGELTYTDAIGGAMTATIDVIRALLSQIEATGAERDVDDSEALRRLHGVLPAEAEPSSPGPARTQPAAAPPPTATPRATAEPAPAASTPLADSTIRVDVALLDTLMNRVSELVLARNQILQIAADSDNPLLQTASQRLNLITSEFQEGVLKTRMQPIGNVWGRFPRVVRDLAQMCGKQVRVEMEGRDTELDKTIIEAIKDPLTHLVRNSVDHGIEAPDDRRTQGKPPEGCLRLRAYHEGGRVNIDVEDDGRGIDLARVRAKAVERGVISAEQAALLDDHGTAQLIFLPGFSTAEQVTHVSGRGVGMDVVKTNIEKIGGAIEVHNRPGQGATIKIKIPLTLAIIPALTVTADGERFAIPQANLLELVRLEGKQAVQGIERVHDAPVYRLRGQLLPVVSLRRVLELPEPPTVDTADATVNLAVLQADDRQFGLIVDTVSDTEEIVVKPLGAHFHSLPVYAGATIMGDGSVALILDVVGIALRASVFADQSRRPQATSAVEKPTTQSRNLLIVEAGHRRLALPMSIVSRLEEFPPHQVEWSGSATVVQYRNGILPLVQLSAALGLPATPAGDDQPLHVVVYQQQGQPAGLVVDRIVDIVDVHLDVDRRIDGALLEGAAVIQNQVTGLVSPEVVARAACRDAADWSNATWETAS